MGKADLHVHTTASDGTQSPEQVVRLAADKGLSTISITDHDTLSGYHKALNIARKLGVKLIPGVEITCDYKNQECHMLAYAFDENHSGLISMLASQKQRRIQRAHKMVHNLNKLGFELDFDDVLGEAGTDSISRVHIAQVLV